MNTLLVSLVLALCKVCTPTTEYEAFASRTYFYAGGRYENVTQPVVGAGQVLTGQIYVEKLVPQNVTQPYPLVFIPGAGQTSTNFLNTPDGREGWASYFLRQGFTIYLTDPPQRGRSPWIPGEGSVAAVTAEAVQRQFTAPEKFLPNGYPQASLHTQWPGTGLMGDPIFDAFFASQVQLQIESSISDNLTKPAYNALLDKIGAAVFVTHSQAGRYGWVVGDSRPDLVKGIIAVEPNGPPFMSDPPPRGTPLLYGLTTPPLLYDPPITDVKTDLKTVVVPPEEEGKRNCTIQAEPARKLVNLSKVPVVVVTGEASYHAPYDYCTVKYLEQTGVPTTSLDLGSEGLHGNGHFAFLEKNNLDVAALVLEWLEKNVR